MEEDAIIAREVDTLKRRLADPDLDKSRMQEYLLRLVYVEMLGHSASFGYIHAVKLTCEHHLPTKRVGYLAVSLFLDDTHDLLILIVNTLQQDLKSSDPLTGALHSASPLDSAQHSRRPTRRRCFHSSSAYQVAHLPTRTPLASLAVAAALTACSKVVSGDNVPSLLPQVTALLAHRSDLVRKKALATLHRFYVKNPASLGHLVPKFRTMLCDKVRGSGHSWLARCISHPSPRRTRLSWLLLSTRCWTWRRRTRGRSATWCHPSSTSSSRHARAHVMASRCSDCC